MILLVILLSFFMFFPQLSIADTVKITAIDFIETENAFYWKTNSEDKIIFYLPKTEIVIAPYNTPGVNRHTATLKFKSFPRPAIEEINIKWKECILRPYSLNITGSCEMLKKDDFKFVVRELDTAGKTISGADESFCRFRFIVTGNNIDTTLALLRKEAEDNVLIHRDIKLSFNINNQVEIPWGLLLDTLKKVYPYDKHVDIDEAVLLVGYSLNSSNVDIGKIEHLKSLIQNCIDHLFIKNTEGGLIVKSDAPKGSLTIQQQKAKEYSL